MIQQGRKLSGFWRGHYGTEDLHAEITKYAICYDGELLSDA